MLSEKLIIAPGLSPAANINGTATTKYISTKGGNRISWLYIQKTGGTNTGTQTITVQAADDNSGTNAVAVPFKYRKKTTGTTSDAWGSTTDATSSGFTTTANEDTIYEIEVDPAVFTANSAADKPWVALKSTQSVSDTVAGAVIAIVQNPRYASASMPSVL